jgi:hypothetical protein
VINEDSKLTVYLQLDRIINEKSQF